jgi:hypothetical protein
VRLGFNLGVYPTVFSRAPESHFFLNNHNSNDTMLRRRELTISEQVTPSPNEPIYTTALPIGGRTSRETFVSRLKSKYQTARDILQSEWTDRQLIRDNHHKGGENLL